MTGNELARRVMACPRVSCSAAPGVRCRSVGGRRMRQVHKERWHAWIRKRRAERKLAKEQAAHAARYEAAAVES